MGSVTNSNVMVRVQTIFRLGEMETLPTYRVISTATTTVCKYGPGNLHRVIFNAPTAATVTLWDSVTTGSSLIATILPPASATPFVLDYRIPFANGLTILTAGSPNLTIVYE